MQWHRTDEIYLNLPSTCSMIILFTTNLTTTSTFSSYISNANKSIYKISERAENSFIKQLINAHVTPSQ